MNIHVNKLNVQQRNLKKKQFPCVDNAQFPTFGQGMPTGSTKKFTGKAT